MRAYIDTNILVDLVLARQEFLPNAQRVFALGYAGEVQLVDCLLNERYPLFAREHPVPHRRVLQMHIAHLAVEVAQRCQLETAAIRNIRLARLLLYHRQELSIG